MSQRVVNYLGKRVMESVFRPDPRGIYRDQRKRWEKAMELLDIPVPENGRITREVLVKASNTGLFTTAIAAMVEKQFRPVLLAQNLIKTQRLQAGGYDSLKIPKGVNLTASEITDFTAAVTPDDQNYGSITISLGWYGLQTSIAKNLLDVGAVDIMADKAEEIGAALARKMDADILAEILAASTKDDSTYGDNSNYTYCGTDKNVSYADLWGAVDGMAALNAEPAAWITNPATRTTIATDTDVKGALAFGTTPQGSIVPMVREICDLPLYVSSQVTANKLHLVDSSRLGYLIDFSDIELWDARLPTKLAFEIIGAKAYGVGIIRPQAVWTIHEKAAEPT